MSNKEIYKINLIIEGNTKINSTDKNKIKNIINKVSKNNEILKLNISEIKTFKTGNMLILELPVSRTNNSLINISLFWALIAKIKRVVNKNINIQLKLPSLVTNNPIEEKLYNKNTDVVVKLMEKPKVQRKSPVQRKPKVQRKSSVKRKSQGKRKSSVKRK